jgi:hypothetical protein
VKFHVNYVKQEAWSVSLVVIRSSDHSLKALKPNPTIVLHSCMQKRELHKGSLLLKIIVIAQFVVRIKARYEEANWHNWNQSYPMSPR